MTSKSATRNKKATMTSEEEEGLVYNQEQQEEATTTPKDKNSTTRYVWIWLRILIAGIITGLCAGITFGYNAIKPVLIDTHVFENLCTNTTEIHRPCFAQEQKMDNMFAIHIGIFYISTYIIGIVFDLLGRQITMFLAGLGWGVFVMLFGLSGPHFDAYTVAYTGISIAGCGMFFGVLTYGSSVPGWGGFINGFVTAMWDLSSAVFYLFSLAHFQWGASIRTMFLSYAAVAVAVMLFSFVMVPDSMEHYRSVFRSIASKFRKDTSIQLNDETPRESQSSTGMDKVLSLVEKIIPYKDIFHLELWFMYIYCLVAVLDMYFYVTTLRRQLVWHNSPTSPKVEKQMTAFSILFPVVGTIAAVIAGKIKDWIGLGNTFALNNILHGIFVATCSIPNSNLQYFTFVVFISWRIIFFVLFNTFFFSTGWYPMQSTGKLLSFGFLIGGVTSTFSIPLLNKTVMTRMNGNFALMNSVLGVAAFVGGILLTITVYIKERRERGKGYEQVK
jgi:MFS family permease